MHFIHTHYTANTSTTDTTTIFAFDQGEFVGGCDIITTMFTEGELDTYMKEQGIEIDEA